MEPNLPFVHPADDPSADTLQRAFGRVEHSVRRRRAQRRALLSAPAAALVVAAAVGTFTGWRGDRGGEVVAGRPDADLEADTSWESLTLAGDRTLVISVLTGVPPCDDDFDHDVVETDESVTVAVQSHAHTPPPSGNVVCPDMAVPKSIEVELGAPLGDREVFDAIHAEPQPVHRASDLVDVTDVPAGWSGAWQVTPGHGWQNTFHKDGADWYFAVNQEPTAEATTPEGTPSPVTVHGIRGTRYSGQMNGTMESIVWVEGGLTITVWGEMQGPPTFTHHDELLQIAEGVRLPS